MLPDIFTGFIKESAVTVMVRSLLERLLHPEQLDAWFDQTAESQYTRDLLFSSVFGLMLEVVCRVRPSVNRAYDAHHASIPVSLASVYNKLNGLETNTSAELVRYSADEAVALIREIGGERESLLPGYRVRMLDGNCLEATEHRISVLRDERAGALPGKSLVVYEPAVGVATDVFPCEDGHAQERSLLNDVLARVSAREVWVADRNFGTADFLTGLAQRDAFFVIREHQGGFRWSPEAPMSVIGDSETGEVSEQPIGFTDKAGHTHHWRRIRVTLLTPTRDGDQSLSLFTNLPAANADALQVALLYRKRWTIETAFQHIEQNLNSEINTLGYPKAALFSFCMALVAHNVMAVVMAALRCQHGEETIDERFSTYAMAEEISTTYRGMMIAIPAQQWQCFKQLPVVEFAAALLEMAAAVKLRAFLKRKQSVKKKKTKPAYDKHRPHVATAKVLAR